ncbi:MAG TPA: ergothioneine biosynthesis protein EgtB, partial [Tepidisphaeraceae bacterium]|nr:ergothioneine biosynthesis protein EgtB [Tepidisphaeraceae bacterium]
CTRNSASDDVSDLEFAAHFCGHRYSVFYIFVDRFDLLRVRAVPPIPDHPSNQKRRMVTTANPTAFAAIDLKELKQRYTDVRALTERLCTPLVAEDYVVQSMPDVSPTKWHLAHTSWFFETFILSPHANNYRVFNPHFAYLFNSYYVTVGDRHCRQNRGQLSRPTVKEVYDYRHHVDEQMLAWLDGLDEPIARAMLPLIDIGLHHEQQHQELMLTDIKHVFWVNPMRPVYQVRAPRDSSALTPMRWIDYAGGVHWIGHDGNGFAFDNESPRHQQFVQPFQFASRLVTNGEYRAFMEDKGYERADLWLSMGIATVKQEDWHAPLYWIRQDGQWMNHTLSGLRPVADDEPVTHLSYFEADAFARWAGARLPSEAEWEVASQRVPMDGNFVENGIYHPAPPPNSESRNTDLQQMFGDVWEWTRSAYLPYPGYQPPAGALGEYNGKFMCNQFVLRGGSCATSRSHIRRTYRNFFPPDARWQFMGLRLARDV